MKPSKHNPLHGYELSSEAKKKLEEMKSDWGNFRIPGESQRAMIKEMETQIYQSTFGDPKNKIPEEQLLPNGIQGWPEQAKIVDQTVTPGIRGTGVSHILHDEPEPEKQVITKEEFIQDLGEFYLVNLIYEMDFDTEEGEAQFLIKLRTPPKTVHSDMVERERDKIINYLEHTKINGIDRIKVSFQSTEVFE